MLSEAEGAGGAANKNDASEQGDDKRAPLGKPSRPSANRNRGRLPLHLPRVDVIIDIGDKSCPCCGGEMHKIGEMVKETLDVVPAQYRVKRIIRPRYGCCESAVVQAPAPAQAIDGGMVTEAFLAYIAVMKYAYHMPLYRLAQMLASQGIALDRATLAFWTCPGLVESHCWGHHISGYRLNAPKNTPFQSGCNRMPLDGLGYQVIENKR